MFFALKVVVWIEAMMIAGWFLWQHAASKEFRRLFQNKHFAFILAIPPLVFLCPSIELIHLIAVILVPLIGRTKEEGVSIFILGLFLFPEMAVDLNIGPIYLITLTIPMSLTVGLGLAYLTRPGSTVAVSKPILTIIILLFGLLLISALRNGGLPMRPAADFMIRVILPFVLLASCLVTKESIRRAMASLLLAGLCLSLLAFIESLRNWPIYQEVYRVHGIPLTFSSALQVRGGVMRAPTTFLESTTFAILLMMCVFVLAWVDNVARSRAWRGILVAVVVAGMVAAVSRGAFIGLAVGMMAATIFQRKYARAATIAGISVVAVILLRVLAPYNAFLNGIFNTRSVSGEADFRVDLWNAGVQIVKDYPLTGLRTDAVVERLSFLKAGGIVDFVNTYLFFTMTGGFGGLLIFASVMLVPGVLLFAARARLQDRANESATVVSMIGALLFLFFFTSYYERNPYWLLIAAAWASALLTVRRSVMAGATAPKPRLRRQGELPRLA